MAKTGILKSFTNEAATSSCVLSGLDAHRATFAPPAFSVRAKLAVSAVMCRQAETFLPLNGLLFVNLLRIAARTGISLSAQRMRFLPPDANDKSATSYFIYQSFLKVNGIEEYKAKLRILQPFISVNMAKKSPFIKYLSRAF
jgi:hypothetical protein